MMISNEVLLAFALASSIGQALTQQPAVAPVVSPTAATARALTYADLPSFEIDKSQGLAVENRSFFDAYG